MIYYSFKKTGPLSSKEQEYLKSMENTEGIILRDNDKIIHFETSDKMLKYVKLYNKSTLVDKTQIRERNGILHEDKISVECIDMENLAVNYVDD